MLPTPYSPFYTLRDLQLLVEDTQIFKQMDDELLDDYYQEFLAVSNSLLDDNLLSPRYRDSLYLQGFPKAFRSQVLQRLSKTKPNILSHEVYDFQDVHSTALLLLSEKSSRSCQQEINRLKEEIAKLAKSIAASTETPQLFPSTTPGGVVQNPPQWRQACAFCSSLEHLIHSCPMASLYRERGWIARYDSGRFCLPGGDPLPLLFPGANLQERADSYWMSLQPREEDWSPVDVFATPEASSNCPSSYEQENSSWMSLEPCEEVRSYSDSLATTPEPLDNCPSSYEQENSYWMSREPREEDRSYSDNFANTFPQSSGNYSSSYDIFLANEGQPPSSDHKDETSPSYIPDSSAPPPLFPQEQLYPGDESIEDTREAEDLVESYLADFFEPEDASSEVPSAVCYVPPIPLPSLEDLFSSSPLSSPSSPIPSHSVAIPLHSFSNPSRSFSMSSTLSQMSSLPPATFSVQAASFSSQVESSPLADFVSCLSSSYPLRSPSPSPSILRESISQLRDLSTSSAHDLSSLSSSCSSPSLALTRDSSPWSLQSRATHPSDFPPPGLPLQRSISLAFAMLSDDLPTSPVSSYPSLQSPTPQLAEQSSQNFVFKTGTKDSSLTIELASDRDNIAMKERPVARSFSQDSFEVYPKPLGHIPEPPTAFPEFSRSLRSFRSLLGVLAEEHLLVPLECPALCTESSQGFHSSRDLLGVQVGDDLLVPKPLRTLWEAPLCSSTLSQSCSIFLNLGRPPDILHQEAHLLDLAERCLASSRTPRHPEICLSVLRGRVVILESVFLELAFAKTSLHPPSSFAVFSYGLV